MKTTMNSMMNDILIVDDIEDNLTLLKTTLELNGYNVYATMNPKETSKILKKNKVDLVILDVNMPELDGMELCKRIKKNEKTSHIPVIFFSAERTTTDDIVTGLDEGADKYLTKPIQEAELLAAIRASVRDKVAFDDALRRVSEERRVFQQACNEAPIAMILYDSSGTPVFMNPGGQAIFSKFSTGTRTRTKPPHGLHPSVIKLLRSLYAKSISARRRKRSNRAETEWTLPDGQELKVLMMILDRDEKDPFGNDYIMVMTQVPSKTLPFDPDTFAIRYGLSRREKELVTLIFQGLSNMEIGEQMFISEHTVKVHLKHIFDKVGVKNRTSLIRKLFV
jgi:DNA-binding NarL/FixJ family response regulator